MNLATFYRKAREEFIELFLSQWSVNEPNLRSYFGRYSIKCNNSKKMIGGSYMQLYNVKYDSLCNFDEYWQYACRGSTIGVSNGQCAFFIIGLPKFFNDTEIPKYMKTETIYTLMDGLQKDNYSFIFMNKEDGSNIRFWYDQFGYLHAYTLGTTAEKEMQEKLKDSPTFTALAIKYLKHYYPKLDDYLKVNPNIVLVAELKSQWNNIVTKYVTDKELGGTITPLILIHPYDRMSWKEIREIYPELYDKKGNPLHSVETSLASYDTDKQEYFKMQKERPEIYGICPEGFVLYAVKEDGSMCLPVAKGKSPEYIEAHRHITLNIGSSDDYMSAQLAKLLDIYDDETGQIGAAVRDEHISLMEKALKTMIEYLNSIFMDLYKNKFSGKDYAAIVKCTTIYNGVWVAWLEPYLFKERAFITEDFDSLDFIKKCLLTKQNESCLYDIQIINIKFGPFWWDKTTHYKEKKAHIVEPEPIKEEVNEKQKEIAVFDFDKTLFEEELNTQIVNMLLLYYKMEIPIVILTGRDMLEKEFVDEMLQPIGIKYTIFCRPSHKTVTIHKMTKMKELATKYNTIYHFEDNVTTINQCAQIVNSNGGQYVGHLVDMGKVRTIINKNESIFVALVGPPGSGKTSVFKMLEKRFDNVSWLSPDLIANTHRENTGEKISPEKMHQQMTQVFKRSTEVGGIVFVDMCHNKSDTIKDIMTSGHKHIIGTFMVTENIKRKGKLVQVPATEYIAFCCENVMRRITTNQMNGSTLTHVNAVEITKKKAEGCLHQIIQRSIPMFADELLSIEEMAHIMEIKIKELLTTTEGISMNMTNSLGETEKLDIQKLGEYVVKL